MLLIVNAVVPVLVKVNVQVPVSPSGVFGQVTERVLSDMSGAMPVPVSCTDCGLPGALSAIVTLPT